MVRKFLADITASIIFFTIAAALSELLIVRLTVEQVIDARLAALPLMVLAARPYGWYRDLVFETFGVVNRGRLAQTVIDTFTFISFQLPVYAAILWWVGATVPQILIACASTIVLMAISARPFGLFLDLVRRLFGVPRKQAAEKRLNG